MWLWDWFWHILSDLGLYRKEAKLVFLGLDNAGKTTLLGLLVNNQIDAFVPTQKPTTEQFTLGTVQFTTHDLGGHEIARRIWREYGAGAQGIIFLVDAADPDRLGEALVELNGLREDEFLTGVPIVVLANKIDLVYSLSETVLRQRLFLTEQHCHAEREQRGRPINLFMCSLVRRQGYKEGIQWLAQFVQ
jgi:GTP-binding protein SAR1